MWRRLGGVEGVVEAGFDYLGIYFIPGRGWKFSTVGVTDGLSGFWSAAEVGWSAMSEVGSFLGGGLQKVEMRFGLLGLCPVLGHVELKLGSFRPGMLNHNFSGPDASNW